MTDPSPTAELADRLYDAIKHGDAVHRAWLHEAVHNFFAGKPVPPPRDQAATLTSQAAEIARMREALDWLAGQHNLEIAYYCPVYGDDDDQAREWRVTKISGPINDREWDVVGMGATPLDAIICARAAAEWVTSHKPRAY